ncbi:MAG: hypothetical protein ACW98F_20145 [Candidatus Hodarchaeales archaeon]
MSVKMGTGKYTNTSQKGGFCSFSCSLRAETRPIARFSLLLCGIGLVIGVVLGNFVPEEQLPIMEGIGGTLIAIGVIGFIIAIQIFIAKSTEDKSQREINLKNLRKSKMMKKYQ